MHLGTNLELGQLRLLVFACRDKASFSHHQLHCEMWFLLWVQQKKVHGYEGEAASMPGAAKVGRHVQR